MNITTTEIYKQYAQQQILVLQKSTKLRDTKNSLKPQISP